MPTSEVSNEELNRLHDFQLVLMDLDRCGHGRHQGDACFGCKDEVSQGNPHMQPGTVIGYGIGGQPIVLPTRDSKHDPTNWRSSGRAL